MCNLPSCLMLVSARDQLWALQKTLHWPYAVRYSNICAKRFTDMPCALEYLEPDRAG